MSKIEKEFVITDSTVNSYGFRLLTEGYQLQEFAKNPIGYFMHKRDEGVLLKWEGLQKKGDTIVGFPNINASHSRADQTIKEINNGYLNAASVGHIIVIESTDDPKLKLPGQTGPTVTKWYNRECSLVDIPANENALTLYNLKGEQINLHLFAKTANLSSSAPLLHLDDDIDNFDIEEMLKNAVQNNDIDQATANELKKQYVNAPDKLYKLLQDFATVRINYLMGLGWDELDKKELLAELKEKYLQGYQQKFYIQFGKEDKSVNEQKKQNSGSIEAEIERLKEFAIKNGDVDHFTASFWEAGLENGLTPEVLKKRFEQAPQNRIDSLMESDWGSLDKNGELEELKRKYFQGFKQKYKEKFGVDYKENK